jgi:N-acetylglucosaminyldiphosphoundecaprenol N-acetyl-beta-D-mannosaminyltransferase
LDKRISFLGIPVDCLSMTETVAKVNEAIAAQRQLHHVVINAGKVVAMHDDKSLFDSVVHSDLINADGQAIVWAIRLLGNKIPERVAGIDLMHNLLQLAHEKGYRCFFLGAKEEIVGKVVEKVSATWSQDIVAGYRNGYFTKEEEPDIAARIAASGANILFVAITSPKKEQFLATYRQILDPVSFIMGVGGSFDVMAGLTKRAPLWMQQAGLEWFYRFLQEPRRMWKRYLVGNSRFILLVLKARLGWHATPHAYPR